jgi:hypothetical protein
MMLKKILIVLTIVLFLIGCAKQPTPPPEQLPDTVDEVDEIGSGISDIDDIDEELDTSDLDEIDPMLEDIENI